MTPQKKSLVKSSGTAKKVGAARTATTGVKATKLEGSKQVNLRRR